MERSSELSALNPSLSKEERQELVIGLLLCGSLHKIQPHSIWGASRLVNVSQWGE